VRVDSALTSLIELREALATNNERGIGLASERLDDDADVLVQARALVGARAQRVETARQREEDVSLVNETILGQLTGLDYTEASSRYSLLELSRQAGLASTSRLTSLSLLDFLL
jgi:flagellin-like hook-associated protein FlgL